MAALIDMTGLTFGRLTVIGRSENDEFGRARWNCACSCGSSTVVSSGNLRNLHTQSCGCLHREIAKAVNTKHKMIHTKEYSVWSNMKDRCTNPKNKRSSTYFGMLCPEWMSFERFLSDMGCAPTLLHSIDRKDNEKGYSKDNCRWATPQEQQNNRTNNHRLTLNGEKLTIAEWSIRTGFSHKVISARMHRGWSEHNALTTPLRKRTKQ